MLYTFIVFFSIVFRTVYFCITDQVNNYCTGRIDSGNHGSGREVRTSGIFFASAYPLRGNHADRVCPLEAAAC